MREWPSQVHREKEESLRFWVMDSTSEAVFQFVYEPGPYDPVIAPGFGISIHSKPAMDGHCLHYVYPDDRIRYKENSQPRFLIGLMIY